MNAHTMLTWNKDICTEGLGEGSADMNLLQQNPELSNWRLYILKGEEIAAFLSHHKAAALREESPNMT